MSRSVNDLGLSSNIVADSSQSPDRTDINASTEYGTSTRNLSMVMSVQKKKKKLDKLTNLNS